MHGERGRHERGEWKREKEGRKREACEGGLVKEELKGGRWRQDR